MVTVPPTVDYTYVFDRGGLHFELNGPDVLPFWDVNTIKGLDLPDYDPSLDPVDGQDGGVIYVKYAGIRTVTANGLLYADPNTIDVEVLRVGQIMTPDNLDRKFWFKHPGMAARYINMKAIEYKYDIETGRRIGTMPYQAQWSAEDPRIYRDEASLNLADNVAQNATNNGHVPMWPKVTIVGDFANAVITNVTTGKSLTLTYDTVGSQTIVVDMRRKTISINTVYNSLIKTAGEFWSVDPGTNSVKVDITTGSATITFAYASAWMV
jgi:hypothetical protein